jgi:hypothetical protein
MAHAVDKAQLRATFARLAALSTKSSQALLDAESALASGALKPEAVEASLKALLAHLKAREADLASAQLAGQAGVLLVDRNEALAKQVDELRAELDKVRRARPRPRPRLCRRRLGSGVGELSRNRRRTSCLRPRR